MIWLLYLSIICFALMVFINWYEGSDLTISDSMAFAIFACIPLLNIIVVFQGACHVCRFRVEGVILKGRK